MELQQLRYVVALARDLHFAKAAKRSNVSQPTLSQQVKKLEGELGTALFERSPRSVRLTDAGRKFLPHAIEALSAVETGLQELKSGEGEVAGTVRLSAIPTIGPYLLPPIVSQIRKTAPKVVLELHEDTTAVLLERLKEGELDLGILSPPVSEKGISVMDLGREPFYLAVSRKHRLVRTSTGVHPRELVSERLLVLQEGHCFGSQSLEYCKRTTGNPQVIFRGSSLLSVMRLAAAGEGVTFVPKMAAETHRDPELRFLHFTRPEPDRALGIVWRVTNPLTRAQKLVMDLIVRHRQNSR